MQIIYGQTLQTGAGCCQMAEQGNVIAFLSQVPVKGPFQIIQCSMSQLLVHLVLTPFPTRQSHTDQCTHMHIHSGII